MATDNKDDGSGVGGGGDGGGGAGGGTGGGTGPGGKGPQGPHLPKGSGDPLPKKQGPNLPKGSGDPPPGTGTLPPATGVSPIIPFPGDSSQQPGRTDVFIPSTEVLPVIYGSVGRVGAQVWYVRVQPDGSLVVVYAICMGPITSISNILIEDQPTSAFNLVGGVNISSYAGTSSQTADPILTAAEPALATGFPNVAYVIIQFPAPSASQPAPDWKRFTCDIVGMRVRDPRSDPTLVSRFNRDNPALCIADYMTSPQRTAADGSKYYYGAGMPDSMIDWSGTITTSANDCDVILADAVTKRFTLGWIINAQKDWRQHVDDMRVQAALLAPQYNNGVYQIVMDKSQAASGVVLTDTGSTANIVATSPLVVKGSADIITHVVSDFINTQAGNKDDTAFDDDAGIASGAVELVANVRNFKFGSMAYDQAKRLCGYIRRRLAKDKSATLYVLNDGGIQILPGIRCVVTSSQLNLSSQDVFVTEVKTSQDPRWAFEVTVELYDATVYDDTQFGSSPNLPPVNQSPYDSPPEITEPVVAIDTTKATVYWSKPYLRSTTQYGASFWSASGTTAFTAAKVNDADLSLQCVGFNTASAAWLTINLGSPKTIREWWVSWTGAAGSQIWDVQFSDDNISFFSAGVIGELITVNGGVTTYVRTLANNGAHPYWRMGKGSIAVLDNTVYTEVWPREWTTVPFNLLREYRVYYQVGGNVATGLYAVIPARFIPTSALPFNVNPMAVHTPATYSSVGSDEVKFIVTTVSTGGKESSGVALRALSNPAALGGQSPSTPQSAQTVTLSNGLNSNIATTQGRGLIELTGPTAAFSAGGFTNPQAGESLMLYYNGTQAGTLVNEDASSTAANRLKTLTGANLVFAAGPFSATFLYSSIAARFVLQWARDSTGVK